MANDGHPAEDFLAPRLDDLLQQARGAGFPREVSTAVLLDLLQRDAEQEVSNPA